MRGLRTALLPWSVLAALGFACFARLAADPTALIVDGRRPSIDHANHGDPRPLGNDTTFVFLPHHIQVAKAIAATGHIPAWDASGFGGRPMVGNPQGGLFYPPVWLVWWSSRPALIGWITGAHLLWGGIGVFRLARGQGLGRWPATLAAGVFQASPYLLAQTFEGHSPHVWSASWFPWAFWAYFEHRAGRISGLLWLPPILALSALAGHPQEWLLLVVTLSIWVAVDSVVLVRGQGVAEALRASLGWMAALALSFGLAAIELAPIAEVLPWVSKGIPAETTPSLPRNYALQPLNGLQLLSPWALGGPADYFGLDNYWETVLCLGLVPLILIAVGISAIVRARPGGVAAAASARGWIILAVVSLWFASGPALGLFTVFYRMIPGMSWFRVPARSLFVTDLAAAMLAGFGLQALQTRLEDPVRWRRFASRLAGIGGLVVGVLLLTVPALAPSANAGKTHDTERTAMAAARAEAVEPNGLPDLHSSRLLWRLGRASGRIVSDPAFGLSIALVALVVASGWTQRRWPMLPNAVHLIGILALGELAVQGFSLIQVAPTRAFLDADPISEAILNLPPTDTSGAPPRVRARDGFYLDLQAVRHGIEKTNVNDVFQLGHAAALYEQLYAVATTTPPLARISFHATQPEDQRRIRQGVFDRMAVSYLVSDRVESDPDWPVAATGKSRDGLPFVIQRNATALPRAYVVPRAEVVADDAVAILRRFAASNPRQSVLMTSDPLASTPARPRQPFTPARWASRDPDRPVIDVTTTAPGLLVIADTWMPGWSALLDGRPTPILRGNHAQRVIPLETPGPHRLELEYQSPGLSFGISLTTASALVWSTFAGFLFLRRNRQVEVSGVYRKHSSPHLFVRPSTKEARLIGLPSS
jgi:hypothetical protein